MPVSTDSLTAKLLRALQIAALALLACVLAHYAAFGGPMQFVLWPAAALALAFGWLYSPIWAIPAAIGAGLWAYAHTSNIVMALGAIAASGLGPMLMVWLLIELGRRKPVEFRIDALLRFTLLAVLVCAPIDALLVAATLAIDSAADATQFTHWFAAWWLLDSVGLLLVVPATLSLWRQPSPSIRTRVAPALHLPSVIATLMIVLVTLQMSNMAQPKIGELALLLYLPVILLASLRLAERTLSLTLPITGAIILCTGSFLAANTPNGSLDIAAALLTLFCTQLALFVQAISADRRQALAKVSDHVRQDFTTGLLNDRGLLTELARQMSLPSRVHQGLIGIHITNFDTIHDLCGPIQAHALEQRIAAVLSKHPHGLHAARLSSGRFALVLECQTVAHLRSIARELYSALNAQTFKANHGALRLQASIGGLQIDSGIVSTSEDVLLSLSDAMAIAASVRVPQLFVEPLTHAIIDARRSHQSKIEHIRTAIRGNYLEVHAQPILDPIAPPAMRCYEILARMRDRDGSLIKPPEFLPLAVQAQMTVELDRTVIAKVFAWFSVNPDALASTYKCSINLSGLTMGDASIAEFIRTQRTQFAIPASKIVFEITESEAIRNPAAASRLVAELKAAGFGIALDDFGTGLATFEYLKRFPLDYLKIDGSFIRDLVDNPFDQEIVLSTVRLAQHLGVTIIAEHVHSRDVYERLIKLGVQHVQGELIGVAMPIEHLFRQPAPKAPKPISADGPNLPHSFTVTHAVRKSPREAA